MTNSRKVIEKYRLVKKGSSPKYVTLEKEDDGCCHIFVGKTPLMTLFNEAYATIAINGAVKMLANIEDRECFKCKLRSKAVL